ncbi:hypothetical protein [Massilia sp. BSC265]|uniref:hypothetical protein n=1 Tax=Massilia sp. BSC265 TaxID=1549812 RepID=UPI0004E93849|nr:hypothetical protein [Massilia sp. BSC265]KFI07537.1 hypothetical protein JN27_08030 [Massilia sp. BSC265]
MNQIQYLDEDAVYLGDATATTDELTFAKYTAWAGAIVAAASLLVMLFVAIVDPYRLFGLVDAEGFNRTKPLPEQYREQIKLAQAKALRPNALLLGNSRIEVGLDPASPYLSAHGYSAYNLALAGTTLTVAQRMSDQMRSQTAPPALALVGLEFLDFLVSPSAVKPEPVKPEGWLHAWQWRFDTLFSMKSLSDAWRTLRLQTTTNPETMTPRGQTPLHEYKNHAAREGYHLLFQQRAQENAKNLVRKPHHLYGPDGTSPSIDRLRQMLATMARDGTEVHLVIYPYHAQLMAMFEEAGLQTALEEWKALLVREVQAVRTRHPGARIRVWDFSGYGSVQCEPIPAPGDTRTATRFYWEAGHFKTSVGELIQQRILGGAASFGVPLTAASLRQNEERIAAERAQCAAAHPEVFAGARSLMSAARNRVH